MEAPAQAESSYTPGGYYLGNTSSDIKTKIIARLISRFSKDFRPARILVVGCGDGNDAAELAKHFETRVNAIDIEDYFHSQNAPLVTYEPMDARNLQFQTGLFDLVYSFHALEHIPEPARAIQEIRRVLRAGGLYCIGTPNRLRLVGYVGVPDFPLQSKIRANLRDWVYRLRGRFRNEFGAHAGFSATELMSLCSVIGSTQDISKAYYTDLYASRPGLISWIIGLRLERIAWPSVYIFGARDQAP